MTETVLDIKNNTRILLARNTPVALVVGAASFLGSHLVDKLLSKDIQVIGADDLTEGKKENLSKAVENKNFHLIITNPEDLNLDLERLDYIFLISQGNQSYHKVFDQFKRLKSRLLLISSIELYDEKISSPQLRQLKKIEEDIAKVAKEDNLNARILRLGPIFGPRMTFKRVEEKIDPIISLIEQNLTGDLQRQDFLDFSSRALYVDDACNLAIKCIFAGATAQKIFDGVLPVPIKVSEIKQVLLDPIWYENKNFTPSELPPWPTPNLEKTIKFLNWQPKSKLVESLKLTVNYFKEGGIDVQKLADKGWSTEKAVDLAAFKKEEGESSKKQQKGGNNRILEKKKLKLPKFSFPSNKFLSLGVLIFIIYALVWPFLQMGWGVLTFRFQLSQAIKSLEKGEFENSLFSISQARSGVTRAKSIFYSLEPIRQMGILKPQFELGDNLANLSTQSLDGAQNTILGIQNLYKSLKSITGELNESPKEYLDSAKTYLTASEEDLSKASALINNGDFKSSLPRIIKVRVDSLSQRLSIYSNLVKKARAASLLLPEVVALEGFHDYLVLLQNNHELRPTGGFIGSFAKVSFAGGKLKKLEVNDIYAIDGQLKIHVEPPKEIKNDLNQKDYFLRDSNWEPDFPTAARQAEWFYTKETGERVSGVVALDTSAIAGLLEIVGSLDLADYNQTITADNLFEKAISHAEVNFFPGTQAKKSFLTALTTALFNKLFFLPNQNWPGIVTSLGKSLAEKHMSIYLDDPALFSYIISQNWAALLPRPNAQTDKYVNDFLAPVEANLGANKANYYLDRSYNLETVIGKDGEINHRLRIAYTNRSPSDAFPAGKYKNRMRVYLNSGSKLTRALWGEVDITQKAESFSDYGRAGYSFLVELLPKEQKILVLDYQLPIKLKYEDKKALYRLDVVKQAGTLKDPFIWNVTYPINVRLNSNQVQKISPQQHSIQTDLSTDKTFLLELSRS